MKKKILTLALIGIFTIIAGAVCACSENKIEYTLSGDGTYYIVSVASNVKGEVVIEATYNGLPVTEIDDWAFYDCEKMTSVAIPNGITKIHAYAFCGCTSLASVKIPDSVTEIHESAFVRCSSLVEVVIPDSVTYLGYSAFQNCAALESVTLSANLEYIGGSLFYLSDNVQYNIYDNAKYVGSAQNDYMLLYSAASTDVTSCEIHENTQFINDYAFSECTSLTEITIDGEISATGYYAFNGCTALEKVTLGENITEISTGSFTGCTALTTINIPDSVTGIESTAFYGCSSLENITIPDSVASIGSGAFEGCDKVLQEIDGVTYVDGWVMFGDNTKTEITLPDGTRGIADSAFVSYAYEGNNSYSDSLLTYIYIPASVKHIGCDAFVGCPLETAVFEDPSGWSVYKKYRGVTEEISDEVLADPAAAATRLTSSYSEYWNKEG